MEPSAGGEAGRRTAGQAGHVIQFGVGDERIAAQLPQQRLDVGAGREADEINAGGGIGFHDHAADLVEEALKLGVRRARTGADEQFVLHEFRRRSGDASRGVEPRRFFRHGAGGSRATGQVNLDFLQFRHAPKGAAQHFPGQQIVVAFQQGFQGLVDILAKDEAGDGGLDAWIEADPHADP